MSFEIDSKTASWLLSLHVISQSNLKQGSDHSTFIIEERISSQFENGIAIFHIAQQLCKKCGIPIALNINHLKKENKTASKLYNWNNINEALKKLNLDIDSDTKTMIINGEKEYLAIFLRKLRNFYQNPTSTEQQSFEDSLQTQKFQSKKNNKQQPFVNSAEMKQSLSLSRSQQPVFETKFAKKSKENLEKMRNASQKKITGQNEENDLLEYIINQINQCLNLTRKQTIALLSDNNKYLAHVFVKGIKNQFTEIEQLMEKIFGNTDYIVQKMMEQNDMCFFFLQIIKPSLLSKSQQIAQWGCRILSKIAFELANLQMLPLAYDWFVRQAGGLSTTILALTRHPKLNQHVVSYILQFARYNVTELFTIQLKKITSNDDLTYIKFILLIFDPLVESKISSEELLSSGAIDYWIEICCKGADQTNNTQMRLYSIEFLTKMWRIYPQHIEEDLDKVNQIMGYIKRGIRSTSQIIRFTLLELLFNLLDEFASKKNPYASIVYKKMTFLFIENHENLNIRQFMLRNLTQTIIKYQSIPVDIFLEPFIKQIKTKQSKSYHLNIFDMEFMNIVVMHKKLKLQIGLDLFDLLAKTKLSNKQFAHLADEAMDNLLNRFLHQDAFYEYTIKLVKVCLAHFYSTYKHKKNQSKNMNDGERMEAQKRAEIINFIISIIDKNSRDLNQEIKKLVIHIKVKISDKLGASYTHRGIERIINMFGNINEEIQEAFNTMRDQTQSNMTSHQANSKNNFHLPKIQQKYIKSQFRDQVSSQQSFQSQGTKYSKSSSKQQFPQKNYTKFAEEDEKKFLKENNIGFKKRNQMSKPLIDKEVDPKIQEQLTKAKQKRQQEQRKKRQQQLKIHRRKQILENKIQKQLEQRKLIQGARGNQKNVEVKVIFDQNQINQKFIQQQDDLAKQINVNEQENRDSQSIKLVLKKYSAFIKKIFSKYSSVKANKKDYFELQGDVMAQIDLIRLCKQKNLEKNKQNIIQILKNANDKNTKNISLENFYKFLQHLCAYLFVKDKCSTHIPMGTHMLGLLKRMSSGENIKLNDDEDEQSKSLTQKIRYNPHIQLPENYKKVYERVFQPKRQCSFPVKKSIKNQSFTNCYEIVNQMLYKMFNFYCLEEEVRFYEEGRVVMKKNTILPPRPRRDKEELLSLLEDKQEAPIPKNRAMSSANKIAKRSYNNISLEKQKENSKPKARVINAAEKKRIQQQEVKRAKKEQQQEQFKKRQQQIRKRMEKIQQQRQRQKSKNKDEKKSIRQKEEEKKKKDKQDKQKYQKQQKQKLQRYKKQREEKQKIENQKLKQIKSKEDEEKKQKFKIQMKKEEQKRKQQNEKVKKQREFSKQKNQKKKQEDQKKKQLNKKKAMKMLEGQKQKLQIQKIYKELLKKLYQQPQIQSVFSNYKEQLKSLFNYGKQFNEFKLGDSNAHHNLEQKGWLSICQQFNICDKNTGNNLLKQNQKENGRLGFNYDQFLECLMNMGTKKDLQQNLEDYDKAKSLSASILNKYIKGLRIPEDKQLMKDFFANLKNKDKKQELNVLNPGGQKQTWQITDK